MNAMLKIVKTFSDIDLDRLLFLYQTDIIKFGEEHFYKLSSFELKRAAEESFIAYLREDFFLQENAFYALWIVQGEYKAALRIQPYRDGVLLDALITAPEGRRKGYAFKLISAVQEYLSAYPYAVMYSHIDKKNLPSIELHKKCGFQLCSDSARYLDGTVTHNSCTMNYLLKK